MQKSSFELARPVTVGTKVYRTALDNTLTPEDLKKAREELNETPETRVAALKTMREMLEEEKDLNPRTDDIYLLRFLRARKFDCERAVKLMKDHYKFQQKHPDIFGMPATFEKSLKANVFNYLPHREDKGRVIFVVKAANWKPSDYIYDHFVATGNIFSEFLLDNQVTQINGYAAIWDFKGFSFKQFLPFCEPRNIWTLVSLMQDNFPARFKMAYCVNTHPIVHTTWNVIKPLIREKFRNRVAILGYSMKELHKYIDPAILPEEYGGVMPPLTNNDDMVNMIIENEDYIRHTRKFGYKPKASKSSTKGDRSLDVHIM